jgi:hypothetical protein
MPTTQEWIDWSSTYARQYYNRDRQMYLEVAMALCGHYRINQGMSDDQNLANADHYWLARFFVFLSSGSVGRTAATPGEALSPMLGQLLGYGGAAVGSLTGGVLVTPIVIAYDVVKQGLIAMGQRGLIPGGEGRVSDPSPQQVEWGLRGIQDGIVFDTEAFHQMRFGSALAEMPGMLSAPPPPPGVEGYNLLGTVA